MSIKKNALVVLSILMSLGTFAQSIKVAAAANLQSVIKVLAADFKSKTNITAEPIVGASGNLVAQIKNGAPFDVFLSADMGFAGVLYSDGYATDEPIVYATGNLIICSTQDLDLKNWSALLLKPEIKKIALANIMTAPYGRAAQEALVNLQIFNKVSAKFVTAESISQVNTYIFTSAVSVGFTSSSFIYDAGQRKKIYWAPIDPALYTPIEQGMVITTYGQKNNAANAQKFYKYMLSSSAKAILKKYGYKTA